MLVVLAVALVTILIIYEVGRPKIANAPTVEVRSQPLPPARPRIVVAPPPATNAVYPPQKHTNIPKTQPNSIYRKLGFEELPGEYPFYVVEKKWDAQGKRYRFYRKGMYGAEVPLKSPEIRWSIQSEDQGNYPEPESGCGPTALLNLYIWYSKYGLINETIHFSDTTRYKQLKFRQIDRKIHEIQGQSRTAAGGTNTLELIVALEEIMESSGNQDTRLHFEIKDSPLQTRDFLNITRGYRAGFLSVRPYDKKRGVLRRNHAVLVVAGDTSGRVTLANWGRFVHGRLVMRDGKQWFVSEDPTQDDLLINRLTTLVPFKPR